MIYSKTCEYALRALSYTHSKSSGKYTRIPEVTRQTGVPGPYVAKIFQSLVRQGILSSKRGPDGGFYLKKEPAKLTILEIIQAVDDFTVKKECVMGLHQCSQRHACPLHTIWDKAKHDIIAKLKVTTLQDLQGALCELPYRELKRSRLRLQF